MFNKEAGSYNPLDIARAALSGSPERDYGRPVGLANLGSMAPATSIGTGGDTVSFSLHAPSLFLC